MTGASSSIFRSAAAFFRPNPPAFMESNDLPPAVNSPGVPSGRRQRDTTEYKKGDVLRGVVCGEVGYGFFVELPNGESGLVHRKEISWPEESFACAVGDSLDVFVLGFRPGIGLSLSFRRARCDVLFDAFCADHHVGEVLGAKIKSIMDYGVFAFVAPGVSGLLHVEDFPKSDTYNYAKSKIGDDVLVRITVINGTDRRISLEPAP